MGIVLFLSWRHNNNLNENYLLLFVTISIFVEVRIWSKLGLILQLWQRAEHVGNNSVSHLRKPRQRILKDSSQSVAETSETCQRFENFHCLGRKIWTALKVKQESDTDSDFPAE